MPEAGAGRGSRDARPLARRGGASALPLHLLAAAGTRWILRQRDLHRPEGRPLGQGVLRRLDPFFAEATLDRVRLVRSGALRRPRLDQEVGALLLELARMRGITYVDTVVVVDRAAEGEVPLPLLFHELVHVVQYGLLGVGGFVRGYLRGWAEGGFRYHAIPLEREAYALQARFRDGTLDGTVEAWVRRELGLTPSTGSGGTPPRAMAEGAPGWDGVPGRTSG